MVELEACCSCHSLHPHAPCAEVSLASKLEGKSFGCGTPIVLLGALGAVKFLLQLYQSVLYLPVPGISISHVNSILQAGVVSVRCRVLLTHREQCLAQQQILIGAS